MNKTKQFWSLLKFQGTVNPFMWIMPLALGAPYFLTSHLNFGSPSLDLILPVQNLFFVGILGVLMIAPERFQYGATNAAWSAGTEYILTRAVDRTVVYRTRVALLYLMVLVFPLVAFVQATKNPDLQVREYSEKERQQCLASIPGSALVPNPRYPGNKDLQLIAIPHGKLLVEGWHLWMFLASALWVQALILFLYARRFRTAIYYIVILTSFLGPMFLMLSNIGSKKIPSIDQAFFFFAKHQMAIWILTALALVICQRWFERWFARLEQ